jgi:uncharacterized membrane protein
LFALDAFDARLKGVMFPVGSQEVTGWLMLAWVGVLAAQGMAWLLAGDPVLEETRPWGRTLSIAGTAMFAVTAVMSWHGVGLTLLWIVGAAVLVGLAPWGKRLRYAEQGAVLVLVAGVRWVAADGLTPVMDHWDVPVVSMWPVFNSMALAGVLLVGLRVWVRRWLDAQMGWLMTLAAGVVGFALANFETLRTVDYYSAQFADFATAKVVALSVLWGLIGLGAVVVGFARRWRELRYAALGLLGVTLVKILFVDMAHARPVYRILSFLAVGGLLLCVSFVYHRHETKTAE